MSEPKHRLHDEVEKLKQRRDELRVRVDLGKKDARDAWEELERKLEHLEGRLKVLARESKGAAGDVAAAADVLVDEVKEGFARLRKLL